MKHLCKHCGKEVEVSKQGKLVPHNHQGSRCPGAGKFVVERKAAK